MQKFQELLTQAAQLKEAQLKNERKNYESLPEYLKSGLNYSRKYQLLRKQDYLIQMSISERLKKEGNELFKIEHYPEALARYEESLGIFRFILTKSYDNMKDDDLEYMSYAVPEERKEYAEEFSNHLVALYLNISSCLTKLNKKQDAIHSADQALKIKQTAKGYYKKAQAYLQFINKEASDIKLGFYYLNKSYELSKDPSIVQQMHKIKKEIDEETVKEKNWFKFMFDKNSQAKKEGENAIEAPKVEAILPKEEAVSKKEGAKLEQLKNFQKEKGEEAEKQDIRLEKTKEKLAKFIDQSLINDEWLQLYEGEFIAKHGSKIYSIIQLYGYKEYLGEYKSLLAQCLEFRRQEQQFSKRKQLYSKYFQWLKEHPIDKISKYTERYDLQTKWIIEQREKEPLSAGESIAKVSKESKESKVEQTESHNEVVDDSKQKEIVELKEQNKSEPVQKPIEEESLKETGETSTVANEQAPLLQEPSEPNEQQVPESDKKQSMLKLYSLVITLVIILILRFVL